MERRDFSDVFPDSVYNCEYRERKGKTVLAVLSEVGARGRVLDIGSSTGGIADTLSGSFESVFGVDVDRGAVRFAAETFHRPNLAFGLVDGMRLPFRDAAFDAVICTHIYEHVEDPHLLMTEIARVLKETGVCYFAAGNRLFPIEVHYWLYFLSWIPRGWAANWYLRLRGRGKIYDVKLLTLWSLRRMVNKHFVIVDYTESLVRKPETYGTQYMVPVGSRNQKWALLLIRWAYWLFPTYIWILKKR
jgi:SAM-dependent methyltransferase